MVKLSFFKVLGILWASLETFEGIVTKCDGLIGKCVDHFFCNRADVFVSSGHSNIDALLQTSFGPDNYTLSWEVGNISFISMFRVYHQGELQGTTLLTSYTVGGLLPCHKYQAKVEALCGENVLMNAKTVAAHTGEPPLFTIRAEGSSGLKQTSLMTTSGLLIQFYVLLYKVTLSEQLSKNRSGDVAHSGPPWAQGA